MATTCNDCKHFHLSAYEDPCAECCKSTNPAYPHWTPASAQAAPSKKVVPIAPERNDNPKQQPDLFPFPSAPVILQDAADVLKERGQSRDKGDSERSMAVIVKIFNAATGLNLTEEQGWKFMLCLKMGRMVGGKFHFDDYIDLVGYSALLAECAALSQLSPAQEPNT